VTLKLTDEKRVQLALYPRRAFHGCIETLGIGYRAGATKSERASEMAARVTGRQVPVAHDASSTQQQERPLTAAEEKLEQDIRESWGRALDSELALCASMDRLGLPV